MAEPNQPSEGNPPQPPPAPQPAEAAAPSPAVSATPPAPAAPKSSVPATSPPVNEGRRNFIVSGAAAVGSTFFGSWFATAWTTFTMSMVGMTLGTVRFMFPNVLSEPPSSFKAGEASSYEEGKVDDKFKEIGAWVIRGKNEQGQEIIYALSTTCTHLGCTPNWLEGEKKFKCPCHGSGFKITGVNFEGPAPRPLERYAIRKTEDGQIIVDKSRKFQKELGQWDETDSYVVV